MNTVRNCSTFSHYFFGGPLRRRHKKWQKRETGFYFDKSSIVGGCRLFWATWQQLIFSQAFATAFQIVPQKCNSEKWKKQVRKYLKNSFLLDSVLAIMLTRQSRNSVKSFVYT
jgi:hypothetical protein